MAALAVFLLAFVARVAFWLVVDQPLLYTHQYQYFTNGLRIAEHPHPLTFILTSDEWRLWDRHWTTAPLYYVFEAAVLRLFGPHLGPLRLIQCVLESLTAVAVAVMGRAVAGPWGAWAGAVYALQWFSVELPCWTLTEDLHLVLFVSALALLMVSRERPGLGAPVSAGVLFGLAALTRSVTTGFIPLAVLWRLFTGARRRAAALAVMVSAAAVILPWTARNVFVMHEPVLIETAAFENIWYANSLVDRPRFEKQQDFIHSRPTPAEKRKAAVEFALRGITRHPGAFLDKVRGNFWHLLRPEGLHNLLTIERSLEPWRHLVTILLDDLVLLAALPPFVAFLAAGRRRPARALIALWTAYFLLMVVVVFHNEIRYRSLLIPFMLAGAAGGVALLADPVARRRSLALAGMAVGLVLSTVIVLRYAAPAARAVTAARELRAAREALFRGDITTADQRAAEAAARDPRSPRPWLRYGRALAHAGRVEDAIAAYTRGAALASIANWDAALALPRLLQAAGRSDEAAHAVRRADVLSWNTDPWLVLEIAWREAAPVRAEEIVLGQGDYGMVRGFLHPRGVDPRISGPRLEWNKYEQLGGPQPPPGPHRWTLARAWLRLVPAQDAAEHEITLYMGSPFPSPLEAPVVTARVNGGPPTRFRLDREIRSYALRAAAPPGAPLVVRLSSPTWCLAGEPAEQGVRVDRMTVAPAGPRLAVLRPGASALYKESSAVGGPLAQW
ncbi:MAG TPA: hypothetical protein VGN09_04955 [Vicinamibacteria bacterium]